MELRVLRYFLLAAQEESITRTAELLHITQPTLSRQFIQLERELGLLAGPAGTAKYEFIHMPRKDRWGILVSKDAPLARCGRIAPADLARTPLLIARRNMVREELRRWFGSSFDSLEIAGTYNLLYNAAVMAEHGVGAVLCMEHDRTYENLRFIPLFPTLETGAVLVWKKNQSCSATTARFFAHVQQCAGRMTSDII